MALLGNNETGNPFPTMVFQISQTWTCPVAMEALVYVIGAGGGGGASHGSSDKQIGGGGAGGCAVSKLNLAAQNYTLTIGSGGDKRTSTSTSVAGNAGGNSSMAGTGMTTMNGLGGQGGQIGANGGGETDGGAANGGTLMNNTGGGCTDSPVTNNVFSRSGGGAPNLWGSNATASVNGIWATGNQDASSKGGDPSGSQLAANAIATNYEPRNSNSEEANQPITNNPFPSLEFIYKSRTSSGVIEFMTAATGQIQNLMTISSRVRAFPVAPFTGGLGAGGTSVNFNCGAGCVGGGGGGFAGRSDSTGISGGGGSGIIIILPISMGG